jgi:hypothetical protein
MAGVPLMKRLSCKAGGVLDNPKTGPNPGKRQHYVSLADLVIAPQAKSSSGHDMEPISSREIGIKPDLFHGN